MTDYEKAERDYIKLLTAVLKGGMDDYIKLQHPKYRKKKYLQEAFDCAVDMFFSKDFSFLYFKNEEGEHMTIQDMLKRIMKTNKVEMQKMKDHLIKESREYWEDKLINTLYIPESLIYNGHVYKILHTEEDSSIDYEEKTIYVNKKPDSENQIDFFLKAIEVSFYHEEIKVKKSDLEKISKTLFSLLRLNGCFIPS